MKPHAIKRKDLPKEEGLTFWGLVKLTGKAIALAYMLYSIVRIFIKG